MKQFYLLFTTLFFTFALVAQEDFRYRNLIFKSASREKNVSYAKAPALKGKAYLLDIYTPDDDTAVLRPLIILMHGGGFKFGSKNNSRMKIWGKHFARMGYVCASINYRLSKKKPLSRFTDLVEGCSDAVTDAGVAIQYLKANAGKFGIDTQSVILAGHSAGGMVALQAVYSSAAEMQHLVKAADGEVPKQPHNKYGIVAVVNFWGAIFDTSWLANARVPITSVHGSKDRVVPINYGETPMYGSAAIHREADRLKIPNALKVFEGKGHELQKHFIPVYAGPVARRRWRVAADFVAEFLYSNFFIDPSQEWRQRSTAFSRL